MPTVLRQGPYQCYFYSHEPFEPPHIHVDRDEQTVKFWLEPIALARNLGFSAVELGKIEKVVIDHQAFLLEKWHEHFGQ